MKNNKQHIILSVYTNLCRFVLAFVFLFSGFVKANDPLGFYYKLQDYLTAFQLIDYFPESLLLFGAIVIAALEFMLGVYLLFGINRRFTSYLVTVLMLFMTPLTLYLALKNPISDCGCFGDAVVLTNWQTFGKNLLLLIAAFSVLKWKESIFRFVTHRSEWFISIYSLTFILFINHFCLQHLPIFDFRPYSIGTNIPDQMAMPADKEGPTYESIFVLEKDGKQQEFSLEDYPDSTWTFIDRRTVLKDQGYIPPIHDFSIIRQEDNKDITEEILTNPSYTILLIAHRLELADDGNTDLVNELYDYCTQYHYPFYCITSSSEEEMTIWKEKTGAEYPFCNADDTTLKTIIRSNPGFVLLKNGNIINKWSHRDTPNEYQLTDSLEKLPLGKKHELGVLQKTGTTLAWFILPLMGLIIIDRLYLRWNSSRRVKK